MSLTNNLGNMIKFLSFSPNVANEWKLIFKIKNKPTACLCRKFVNNGYFYVNTHTNKIICLCREMLNFDGGFSCRHSASHLTAYNDTSIFDEGVYDRYMRQCVFNEYLTLVNEAEGFDELTLLYFDMRQFINDNAMDFLLPIFTKLKSKYDESHRRGNPPLSLKEQLLNKYLNYEQPTKYSKMMVK